MAATDQRPVAVFLASENDALAGAKVGGIADVVRDLPRAMERFGWSPAVIVPSYGFLHRKNPSEKIFEAEFPFRGRTEIAEIWRALPRTEMKRSRTSQLILHHPAIAGDPIYFNDPPERVFARDAEKFALFCSAAAMALKKLQPAVVHLHDWHTGFYFLLAGLHPSFGHLAGCRTVFTIHNVGYQGSRPASSINEWFPEIASIASGAGRPDRLDRLEWTDPRYADPVFNPMLAAIGHADVVTTVSPTYALEITRPSDNANGAIGGEGLEGPLARLRDERRLVGILNGIDYPRAAAPNPVVDPGAVAVEEMANAHVDPATAAQVRKLGRIGPKTFVMTSVSRITAQKMSLLFAPAPPPHSGGRATVLERMLDRIAGRDAVYVLLGTGEEAFESQLARISREREKFIFINRFFARTADALYRRGDLFVMPSSYEPCGISQMIAMRAGQPCLVHAVGGLKDTVIDGGNGFTFNGPTIEARSARLLAVFDRALAMHDTDPEAWGHLRRAAKKARFTWGKSAALFDEIYRNRGPNARPDPDGRAGPAGRDSLAFQKGAAYIP